jgi:hypothetical protein
MVRTLLKYNNSTPNTPRKISEPLSCKNTKCPLSEKLHKKHPCPRNHETTWDRFHSLPILCRTSKLHSLAQWGYTPLMKNALRLTLGPFIVVKIYIYISIHLLITYVFFSCVFYSELLAYQRARGVIQESTWTYAPWSSLVKLCAETPVDWWLSTSRTGI